MYLKNLTLLISTSKCWQANHFPAGHVGILQFKTNVQACGELSTLLIKLMQITVN